MTWQEREFSRFNSGAYKPIPNIGLIWPADHFSHMSEKQAGMIAYTPSPEKGEADRQVIIKPGRYIRQCFPDLTDCQIKAYVEAISGKLGASTATLELHFTREIAKINGIFETKMCAHGSVNESCMFDKFTEWENRPYHVYANSPDVSVAYLSFGDSIVARTVVSERKKEWVRCYSADCDLDTLDGLCNTLREMLKEKGFKYGGLSGDKLTKLPMRREQHVLPYLDGGMGVWDQGDSWHVVDEDSSDCEWVCDQTNGTATEKIEKCDGCDCSRDECDCECEVESECVAV